MSITHKQTLLGGFIAFVFATSCCWLPALVIMLGGASGLVAVSEGFEKFSGAFMAIGAVLVLVGIYQFQRRKTKSKEMDIELISTITCPHCGHQKEETMPTNACQFFYDCEKCKAVLKPKKGDCCVYCSFGSVKCPPIQQGENCC